MDKINEVQVLTNIRLSHAQKFVLAKLMLPNATPLTSYESVSSGKNVVANRNVLIKLGMVKVGANEAQITEKGKDALKNENLVDDMGTLTPQGEQYAYATDLEDLAKIAAKDQKDPETPAPELGTTQETPPGGAQQPTEIASQNDAGTPMPETWSMISDMQTELSEKRFIKKHSKKL